MIGLSHTWNTQVIVEVNAPLYLCVVILLILAVLV